MKAKEPPVTINLISHEEAVLRITGPSGRRQLGDNNDPVVVLAIPKGNSLYNALETFMRSQVHTTGTQRTYEELKRVDDFVIDRERDENGATLYLRPKESILGFLEEEGFITKSDKTRVTEKVPVVTQQRGSAASKQFLKTTPPNDRGFICEIVPPSPGRGERNDHFNAPELKISYDPKRTTARSDFLRFMDAEDETTGQKVNERLIGAGHLDEKGRQTVRLKGSYDFLPQLIKYNIETSEGVEQLQDDYQRMGIPRRGSGVPAR